MKAIDLLLSNLRLFQLLYKYQKGHSATLEMPKGPKRNFVLGKKKIEEEDE